MNKELSHFIRIILTILFASQTNSLVSSSSSGSDDKVMSIDQVVLINNNQLETAFKLISPIPRHPNAPQRLYSKSTAQIKFEPKMAPTNHQSDYIFQTNELSQYYFNRTQERYKAQEACYIEALRLATMVEHEDLCHQVHLPTLEALVSLKAIEHNKVIPTINYISQEHEQRILKDRYALYFDSTKDLSLRLRSRIEHERNSRNQSENKKQSTFPSSFPFRLHFHLRLS